MAFAPAASIPLPGAAAATTAASDTAGRPTAPVRIDARLEPPAGHEPLEHLEPAQPRVADPLAAPIRDEQRAPIVTDATAGRPLALADHGAADVPRDVTSPDPQARLAPDPVAPPDRVPQAGAVPAPDPVPGPDRIAHAATVGADYPADARSGCTAAQLRRFIKSRAYVPLHELRRRFELSGDEDDVSPIDLGDRRLFVGLPAREARLLGELLEAGDVGYELLLDPASPLVVGVFPMRPVPRS